MRGRDYRMIVLRQTETNCHRSRSWDVPFCLKTIIRPSWVLTDILCSLTTQHTTILALALKIKPFFDLSLLKFIFILQLLDVLLVETQNCNLSGYEENGQIETAMSKKVTKWWHWIFRVFFFDHYAVWLCCIYF